MNAAALKKNQITEENVVREFFRIPVSEVDPVEIKIDGVPYEVANVASNGIGITVNKPELFQGDDRKHDVDLTIAGSTYQSIGEIVHISPGDSGYLCGIELIDLDEDVYLQLQDYMHRNRVSLFCK